MFFEQIPKKHTSFCCRRFWNVIDTLTLGNGHKVPDRMTRNMEGKWALHGQESVKPRLASVIPRPTRTRESQPEGKAYKNWHNTK